MNTVKVYGTLKVVTLLTPWTVSHIYHINSSNEFLKNGKTFQYKGLRHKEHLSFSKYLVLNNSDIYGTSGTGYISYL